MSFIENIEGYTSTFLPKNWGYGIRDVAREIRSLWYQALYPKRYNRALDLVQSRPVRLGIETINICNADCIFCAYGKQERPKKVMDMEVYKKIVEEYHKLGGGAVELTPVVGEALLDRYILERIRILSSYSSINEIMMYTNGILLDKIGIDSILSSGITHLNISTGTPDEESYRKLYRYDDYERVHRNIVRLLEINWDMGRPVRIQVCFRSEKSAHQIAKMPNYKELRALGCDFNFSHYYDDWNGAIKSQDLLNGMKIKPVPKKQGPCELLMVYPKVLVDGTVTACGCRDYNGDSELVIGNIHENTLGEIWGNGRLKKIYRRFYDRDYPDICKDCKLYRNGRHFLASKEGRDILREEIKNRG